ncbi:uncharacterized protein LOC121268761 isoform X2 [Juglans microcarpa x Juglans regia]|uniref:uncharacterized protein LOC121268761 isoform X2 n=1 Tax=Juglans microcarpa x Juglans regia TaxID=2249226 RepID=UPI001B7EF4A6|nr:uncharacterized protein LOC121268761 isoform X2 [Juglans microcarpa x Juglans regia]
MEMFSVSSVEHTMWSYSVVEALAMKIVFAIGKSFVRPSVGLSMDNFSSPMLNPQIVAHENHRSPPQANGDLHAQLSSPSYASLCSSTPDVVRHKLLSRYRQMKQMLHYTSSSTTINGVRCLTCG